MLCRFLLFLLGNLADAEDLAQETFRIALSKERAPEKASGYGAYLRSIARNLVRNHIRKHRSGRILLRQDILEVAERRFVETGSDHDEAWEARRQALLACLERLPEADRGLLRKRYELGQPVQQMAKELGMEPNSLSKRLQRIRDSLRESINATLNGEPHE
jgi:RNA polymerase sigma-70 factor (ECF subfamily)